MILHWLDNNQPTEGQFTFTISGKSVCSNGWIMTLGITRRRFYSLKSDYLQGRRSEKHGSFGIIPRSEETDKTINYLEIYFKEQCDYLPNTAHWHLSSSTKRTDVYQDMTRAMIARGLSVCSYATFRKVWQSHFPHVKIPKVNTWIHLSILVYCCLNVGLFCIGCIFVRYYFSSHKIATHALSDFQRNILCTD